MRKIAGLVVLTGALCTATAGADQARSITEADWDAAAAAALSVVEHGHESIVVLDDKLSLDAQEAFKHLRRTTALERLPQRDKYALPPGAHYLWVRQFELRGEQFEFAITAGVIPKNAGLNCGETERFVVLRDGAGTWKPAPERSSVVC